MAKAKMIVLNPLRRATLKVEIHGASPLLVHQFGSEARRKIEAKQQGEQLGGREKRDPEAEWKDSLYTFPGDKVLSPGCRYGFKAIAFKKALVSACRFIEGFPMTIARGAFFVKADSEARVPGLVRIIGTPKRHDDMVRTATKVAMPRYRGVFEEWSAVLEIDFDPNNISDVMLLGLIQRAGFHVGVGESRPEQNGNELGQFTVGRVISRKQSAEIGHGGSMKLQTEDADGDETEEAPAVAHATNGNGKAHKAAKPKAKKPAKNRLVGAR